MAHADTRCKRLRLSDVAERLTVSVRQIKAWLRSGELRGIDVSSKRGSLRPRFVVDEADLIDFENRRATSPAPQPSTRRSAARRPVPNLLGL